MPATMPFFQPRAGKLQRHPPHTNATGIEVALKLQQFSRQRCMLFLMRGDVGITVLLHDLFGGEVCPPRPWLIARCNWFRTDTRFYVARRFILNAFLNADRQGIVPDHEWSRCCRHKLFIG
jgi:hypothetical protein